jgi:fatty acid-binding protein DegV
MKTLNATLLAALIAIPAVSFADGGNEPFVNIHSQASAVDVRAQAVATRGGYGNNEATAGLIALNDAAPKTREQVRAEILEASRLGVLRMGEQTVLPTAEQQTLITLAGLRALNGTPMAGDPAVVALIASPNSAK